MLYFNTAVGLWITKVRSRWTIYVGICTTVGGLEIGISSGGLFSFKNGGLLKKIPMKLIKSKAGEID